MKITCLDELQTIENEHRVNAKIMHSNPLVQAVVITLNPGEALKKHTTPVDVFFYVLEGKGVVEIGEEREEVGVNMLIESPAKIPHRLENIGEGTFRFLVVKTPNPVAR